MLETFPLSQFNKQFFDNDSCFDEITRLKYPDGIFCQHCDQLTTHYKITNRTAYGCKHCRNQVYPLKGTIFEKSTTPLSTWFYALYLMTQTRARLSIRELRTELGVTYKTAWRMYQLIRRLMEENEGDLLREPSALIKTQDKETGVKIYKWVLFNAIEVKVVHRHESS